MGTRVLLATQNNQPVVVGVGVGAVVTCGQGRGRRKGKSGIVSSLGMGGVDDALVRVILPTEGGRRVEVFVAGEH